MPKRIVVFAYACEPGSGSEPGTGWAWAHLLAGLGDVCVLTRANNRPAIEAEIGSPSEGEGLSFVYVDLPQWARWWKRGSRGLRLYYLLWQTAATLRARQLHRAEAFDLAWHVTLANAWLGSLGWLVGTGFVLGPVGGGQRIPLRFLPALGGRGLLSELLRGLAQGAGRFANPLARIAWRRAKLILVCNPETKQWLPAKYRSKTVVLPNAVLDDDLIQNHGRRESPPTALFAGRLVAWKGPALALRAVAVTTDWRLLLCGSGPESARLRRLSKTLGIEDRVFFEPWLPRQDLLRIMRQRAHVLLFPSLREDSGWVVAEALACGLPVICVDRGGPPLLADQAGLTANLRGGPRQLVDELRACLEAVRGDDARHARALERAWNLTLKERLVAVATLLEQQTTPTTQASRELAEW